MVKKIFGMFLVCAVLFSGASAYSLELEVENNSSIAIYEEKDSLGSVDLSSDWKAYHNKTTLYVSDYNNEKFEGEVRYGMYFTPKAQEKWDINGSRYQTNDMSLWGIDTGFLVGYAIPFTTDAVDITITPLVGYSWKFTRFSRSNFNILNTFTIAETVDEDYNVHYVDAGMRLNFDVDGKFDIYLKPIFGVVLYNSAKNSALGTIKGDGGYVLDLDAGIEYPLSEDMILDVAFVGEWQKLQGAEKDNVLWPNNTFSSYGIKIGIKHKF